MDENYAPFQLKLEERKGWPFRTKKEEKKSVFWVRLAKRRFLVLLLEEGRKGRENSLHLNLNKMINKNLKPRKTTRILIKEKKTDFCGAGPRSSKFVITTLVSTGKRMSFTHIRH